MKILHLLNSDRFSGAENVACQIIEMFRDEPDVEMVYVSRDGPISENLRHRGIKFVPIKAFNIIELTRIIHCEKPDVIHAHDFTASCAAALCHGSIPLISHLHQNPEWLKRKSIKSMVFFLSLSRYTKVLTVSDSICEEYVFGYAMREKTLCIGNPVNTSAIKSKVVSNNNERHIDYDIIVLGRLSHEKNPIRAIEIMESVAEKLLIRCVMVGDGELYGECEALINEHGMKDAVELAGFQDNPYDYLNRSRILLIPSRWEGFGLAAVEALTYGLPVVASPVGGLKGIVNEKCGKLCSTNEEFSEEIKRLLNDSQYYESKSRGALNRAKQLDNTETYFSSLKKVYGEAINAVDG